MVAIDLGSNTLRFIEFDGKRWGKSFEKIVRTAEGLHQTHRIGEPAIGRIINAINEAKHIIDFTAQPIRAYTTAAMRIASNADETLALIAQASGIRFDIIDGEKEAILTLDAVRNRLRILGIEPASFLLADIGGGSTELTRYCDSQIETLSLNFGIVTLSEAGLNQPDDKMQSFKIALQETFSHRSEPLILTAGTPTTIAAYLNGMDYESYDPKKVNGYHLTLSDCYSVYDALLAMDEVERRRYVGVGRENLIITGILMVTAIYEAVGADEAIIIDDGLREGIALEYYKLH
ncbi:phosphatase [Sulfuricurvum sp.]|uniref:Ppx/GppA phosphatase family protein n=1 Tax=Sulfuricurvum sp. TaxID=2025608 RepID=UPI0025D9FFDA|nr:phosphatase [Sulfuricurvum sp.]